ncbi:MAG TPA: diguanylate cyclase [Treponema sp.]|nr:diguanylate cyclase [Treponema sp.]
MGGEEFLIIAPNLSLQQGRQFAEIIRGGISSHTFSEIGNVTVSLGVTELKKDISMEDVFKTVDELLYQAKAEGRNRVC